ncbi:MAG: hypothetical protein D6781_08385 [Verrucomicrobia bacterium]|nr:MAG: hypothetical protein D6781_08385 [Verrucomicrobiota bacterium]
MDHTIPESSGAGLLDSLSAFAAGPSPATLLPASVLGELDSTRLPLPARALAIARANPFWFEPCFALSPGGIPPGRDIALFLWEEPDGRCGALLPLISENGRAILQVRNEPTVLHAAWQPDTGAAATGEEPALALGCDTDPFAAIRSAVAAARTALRTFRCREEKPLPAYIDYLGWCTWDAFYQDVSADGIREGLLQLTRGGVRPGFIIIDDGWQVARDFRMIDFATDPAKFPEGLAPVVKEARETFHVRHVGIWHTLQGYWAGVDPRGPLSGRYAITHCPGRSPDFTGWPDQFTVDSRDMIEPQDIARFYLDFYQWLAAQGIDFVKVDNQAMMQQFAGDRLPRIATQTAYQRALQGAGAVHFGGAVLHCMSNVTDILLRLSVSNLWRNSDDYYPAKPAAYQANFVTINAFNNLLTARFALPDWDMFQSARPHAHFHAAARAISGGPVMISDTPGSHDHALLRRLCLADGRVPRWPRPARPARDRLFEDPRSNGRLLKIVNGSAHAAAVGLFHVGLPAADGEAPPPASDTLSAADVPLPAGPDGDSGLLAIGSESGTIIRLTAAQAHPVRLAHLEAEIFTVGIRERGITAFGLEGMLNGGAALIGRGWSSATTFRAQLMAAEGATALFHCDQPPAAVRLNDRNVSARYDAATGLLRVALDGAAPAAVVEVDIAPN